jgi:regulator of cell morphogenesis and NO signaling
MISASSQLITVSDTINDIVAKYPAALSVLQRFGLDTCCGGALPLATAASHHSLDADEVMAALLRECATPEAKE